VARKAAFSEQTIIVNVQGDEPELDPSVLEQLVDRMARDPDCPVGTLATPFPPGIDPADPNRVKVVVDSQHRALFFFAIFDTMYQESIGGRDRAW
jgi:3-deoxy-manno-octulosonate cytidylyltransferase (CMP-KDO synthetase)